MTRRIKITAIQLKAGNFRIDVKGKFSERDLILVANAIIRSVVRKVPIEAGAAAAHLIKTITENPELMKDEQ